MTNEELCERVFRAKPSQSGLRPQWDKGYDHALRHCREDLADSVDRGILIPAERLLTVEEMMQASAQAYCSDKNKHKVLDSDLLVDICEVIHQSSRQKAGIK